MQSGKESDDSGVGDNTPTTPKSGMEESGFHGPEIMAEEYKAIENYKADGPGQVSFEEGDIIHVLDKLEDGKPVANIISRINYTLPWSPTQTDRIMDCLLF